MSNLHTLLDRAYNTLMSNPNALPFIKVAAEKAYNSVKIYYNPRFRTKAGLAKCRINRLTNTINDPEIEISQAIFAEISDDEKYNTVSHEFAHIVDYFHRLTSNHDEFWNSIHRLMNGSGAAFHKYDVQRNTVKRVKLLDTLTGKTLLVTTRHWDKVAAHAAPRYQKCGIVLMQGRQQVGEY